MPRTSPKRDGYARGRETRERIIRRAVVVFADRGYRGGSLKEVADGIGISQAGLLHHFASKQELLAEVLDRLDEGRPGELAADAPSGWALLRSAEAAAERTSEEEQLARLVTTLLGEAVAADHPAREHFRARHASDRSRVRAAVAHAQRNSDVDVRLDPEVVAVMLLALLDGLRLQWLLDPESVDMAHAVRSFLGLVRDPRRRAAGLGEPYSGAEPRLPSTTSATTGRVGPVG